MTAVARYSARTDTGKKRRRNEDAFVLAPPLFAVADGMGGAQAGEVASRLAAAASFDATSPACAPPMPSATAKSGGATT